MKTIKKNIVLLLFLFGMIGMTSQKATSQVSVSFQMFYDNLSVHGNWISDPNYGYVWLPNVSAGFAPYRTNGHWVYTDYGWTWVSNYSWGWAPFHYGRWYYDSYYGWLWAPDTVWAPAWVTWRYYDGYYGWAAIGPGISVDIAFGNSYSIPYNQWVFVRDRDFDRPNISNYYINKSKNTTIIKNSVVVNSIQTNKGNRYNAGPARGHVQKRVGHEIAQVNVKDRNKPGQKISGKELQLYKPRVEINNDNRKEFPSKVMEYKNSKPIAERRVQSKIEKVNNNTSKLSNTKQEQSIKQKENNQRKIEQRQKRVESNTVQMQEQRKAMERIERARADQIQQRSEQRIRNTPIQDNGRRNNFQNTQQEPIRQLEPQHQMMPRGNPNVENGMPHGMRGALKRN